MSILTWIEQEGFCKLSSLFSDKLLPVKKSLFALP